MPRRKPPADQAALPLTGGKREPVGTVERAAAADVRELAELELLGAGADALAKAYRVAAREVDRAARARDTWAATAAIRELRATRLELAPIVRPTSDDELEQIIASIATELEELRRR